MCQAVVENSIRVYRVLYRMLQHLDVPADEEIEIEILLVIAEWARRLLCSFHRAAIK